MTSPISRILSRRTSPVFTAFCDGALALSIAAAIMPAHPWAGLIVAVLATIPEWLNIVRRSHCGKMVFAPDPLAPDFSAFTAAFLDSAAKCATEGTPVKWTLCPCCGKDGAFETYRLDLRPAKGELAIGTEPHLHCKKTDNVFRPRLPLPVEVRDEPVTLVLSPAGERHQVFIDTGSRFALPWNRRGGNLLRDDIIKLCPALAFAAAAALPDTPFAAPERLAAIAVLLVFATFALAKRRG